VRTRLRYHKLAVVLLVPVSLGLACHVWDYLHYPGGPERPWRGETLPRRASQFLQCLMVLALYYRAARRTWRPARMAPKKQAPTTKAERHLKDALKRGGEPEAINLEHLLLRAPAR